MLTPVWVADVTVPGPANRLRIVSGLVGLVFLLGAAFGALLRKSRYGERGPM